MIEEIWQDRAWVFVLVSLVFSSTFTFLLVLTLPSLYSPARPRFITERIFLDEHKQKRNKKFSGFARYEQNKGENGRLPVDCSVQIVVLGDIGRSPRVQYHALSIASHGGLVDIIGYAGSDVHPDVARHPMIQILPITPFPSEWQTNNKLLFLFVAPLKVLWQVWHLYWTLAYRSKASKWLLVQNPPSIPTLAVCQLICYLRNTQLVIDWHNFGYSILALRLGPKHPLVCISDWYEGIFSRSATAHFAVTNAMTRVLDTRYRVKALPLHDRPASIYQPLSSSVRTAFLKTNFTTSPYAASIVSASTRLLVSSTSWTADEDFSLLLAALTTYATHRATISPHLPKVLAVITGRGPQRNHYLAQIAALNVTDKLAPHVEIETAWLSASDYALLLGSGDLGVSLHTSSSGVDLPMKVVDMFGAGLPVVGWGEFEAWSELVKEGVNGRSFGSAERLGEVLEELFGGDGTELARLRDGAVKEGWRRWADEWDAVAGKLFDLVKDVEVEETA